MVSVTPARRADGRNESLLRSMRAARHPLLALIGVLIVAGAATIGDRLWEAARQRDSLKEQTRTLARSAATAIDRELASAASLLDGLATSPALRSGDLEAFYRQLQATHHPPDTWFVVRGNPPRQILNTLVPYGAPLPEADTAAESWNKVIERREAGAINVIWGNVAGRDVMGMGVPVINERHVDYVLALSMAPRSLVRIFEDLQIPAGWSVVLHDPDGNTVATSRPDDETLPRRSAPAFWQQVGNRGRGDFVRDEPGGALFTAFHRVTLAPWVVVAAAPLDLVEAPLRQAFRGTIAIGGFLLLGSIGLALWAARRMHLPLREMVHTVIAAESSRDDAEARYRAYWEHTSEALFVVEVTEDGRFRFEGLNPEHERLTGLDSEALRGREPHQCVSPDIADWVTANYRRCVWTGIPIRYEEELALPAGTRRWETNLVPIRDAATGRVVRLLGSGRDITERRDAEQAVRIESKRWQLVQEAAGIGTWEWDILQEELHWSPEAYRLFGIDPSVRGSALYHAWREALHPDDRDRIDATTWDLLAAGRPFAIEFRIVRDGEVRWMLGRGMAIPDPATGKIERMIGVNLDITERRLAEDAIRTQEARFRAMAETVSDVLFISTPRGCEYLSPRFGEKTGMAPSVSRGMGWIEAIHPADRPRVLDARARGEESGNAFELQLRLRSAAGSYRWHVGRWNPVRDAAGGLTWFGTFTDVEDINAAQEALRELTGGLLAAQDEERRRIARELHDSTSQTLVAAMLALDLSRGRAGVLPDEVAVPLAQARELVDQSQREIRTLSYLLHPPVLDDIGLTAAVRWYADGFSSRTGIAVEVDVDSGLWGRRFRQEIETALYRVLQEALTNVYRHAKVGSAHVTLDHVEDRNGGRHRIVLEVRDEGAGIDATAASRGDTAASGVGLASMRERVRHLDGRLDIRSDPSGTVIRAEVWAEPIVPAYAEPEFPAVAENR